MELAVGALLAGTCSAAAAWGALEMRSRMSDVRHAALDPVGDVGALPEPQAAGRAARGDLVAVAETVPAPVAPPEVVVDVHPARRPWVGEFNGKPDDELVAPLRDSPIVEVKPNKGGTSLSLRIDFENGARAACKPMQIHTHSQPRREIAAYRVNRLLGLSSVPPAVPRRFRISDIVDHLRGGSTTRARVLSQMVGDPDGTVLAELSWWIPVLEPARVDRFEIDSTDGIVTWKRYLAAGGRPIPDDQLDTVAQVSDLVLFDFVINNSDRWSGGNVKASEDRRVVYFMDNTLSFGDDDNGHHKVRTYLERVEKFSRRLVARLRALSENDVREAMTREVEPFEQLLGDVEIRSLFARRDLAIRYIDGLIDVHGEDAVLVFP
jgi:hypothetical protein